MARLSGRRVVVDVPATSANLGAGFDVLALALDLGNRIAVRAVDPGRGAPVEVRVRGEGAGQLPTDGRNRFVACLERGLAAAGVPASGVGWRVDMDNRIPVARGLGSSASATVAALVAADALTDGGLGQDRILELATHIEGHGDNAAAALLGGLCVVTPHGSRPTAVRITPPADLRVVLFIPDRPLSTAAMRTVLPESVPFRDAVHNVGAAALAVAALATGRLELLGPATVDRLHEPYRAAAYPELPELVSAAREGGALGACLSGAGSTVIAFTRGEEDAAGIAEALEVRAARLGLAGRACLQRVRADGARVSMDDADGAHDPGDADRPTASDEAAPGRPRDAGEPGGSGVGHLA
jgi:homoserine kinase